VLAAAFLFSPVAHSSNTSTVQPIDLQQLDELIASQNNRIMIVFMAAWCGPCIEELPTLVKLFNRYRSKGFQIVGVASDLEGPLAMQPIIDRMKVNFPVYWIGEKVIDYFKITAIPMLFFVKDGSIEERIAGLRSEEFLDRKIITLLE